MKPITQRTRIYLVHSSPIVNAGLHAILADSPGLEIHPPGCQPGANEPCVLIADYDSALRIAQTYMVRLLVVTQEGKAAAIQKALDHGVHGYLMQDADADELLECVRLLALGQRYLGAAAGSSLASVMARQPLTPREADVLSVLSIGLPDKRIARELGISVGTVKTHMKQLMRKFEASSRTQVVLNAMAQGLLLTPPA